MLRVMSKRKADAIRRQWRGPGSLDELVYELAYPARYSKALAEIRARSGVTVTRRTLEAYVRATRRGEPL